MNKNQWIILGTGLFIVGLVLLMLRGPICLGIGDSLTACMVRRYMFAIPGIILMGLGVIFDFVGFASKN